MAKTFLLIHGAWLTPNCWSEFRQLIEAKGHHINAAPPRGILTSFTATRSAFPIFSAWRGWSRILLMSFKSFSKTFANTLPSSLQRTALDRHIVPTPGGIYFQATLDIGVISILRNDLAG